MKLRLLLLLAGAVVGAIGGMAVLRQKDSAAQLQHVPRAPIVIDGPNEWQHASRTGAFVGPDGRPARPFSEARFAWGEGKLYALLYAADEDIRSDSDVFHLELAGHAFDVSPLGSSVASAHDVDGTIDDPKDDDEEWVIEMAIPLAALGIEQKAGALIPFSVKRCDTPKRSSRSSGLACGESNGVLVLE